ncbi:uncharacterized protein C10orf62 homolog [Mesocricetus auratus]|uniref:Uncharacterized protein C10orf62 homolog n=1 Tax=Mesocricetus auratus TaxID=10036 RepID=A0A3Q0C9E6_MESAU|nr:uncharacterized protein C10orf62 homolog [Mesocricetus auratus]
MLWAQRKKRKTAIEESSGDRPPESCRGNDSWIKSHFSRLSEERLPTHLYAGVNGSSCENRHKEANTTIHMDTLTSTHGEGGMVLHRDSFTSKQKVSGTSVTKETQRESGKTLSMEDDAWAAVAACTKEIDAKGHHLANSMLQRAKTYKQTGHVESRDISPEELKALEEVEIKLKRNFLTHRETTIAGSNQMHTVYSQSRHGHQHSHPSHQSHQSHPVHSRDQGHHSSHQSHQSHPGHSRDQGHHSSHLSHQSHPGHSSHQSHPGHSSHQSHPGHSSHQSHPGHSSHQSHPGHSSHQSHLDHSNHQSHQGQPGDASHENHSLPNRSNQICDS